MNQYLFIIFIHSFENKFIFFLNLNLLCKHKSMPICGENFNKLKGIEKYDKIRLFCMVHVN